jgi:uncharacterized repeat protein (TIGR03806 family)
MAKTAGTAALVIALLGPSSPEASAATFLPGFYVATVARGLTGATAMEVAPDGRIFVCEQTGALRVIKNNVLLETPFTKVTVDSSWERGLLGVALDPQFPEQPFVYLCSIAPAPYPHHRISRFTARGDVAVPESEVILFEGDDQSGLGGGVKNGHQGGAIHFGPDGKLYIAIGDQTAGAPAQSLSTLQGKILRLNPDGSIPPGNPFYRKTTGKYRAIWALGLRNPFTFAFQPGTGRMFINDVGGANEEINVGAAGANYGWPTVEHGPTSDPRFRGPILWYPESSITGGTFYNPSRPQFPAAYVGKYFLGDFKAGWIKVLDPADPRHPREFASGFPSNHGIVDLKVAPDGGLFLLDRGAWVKDMEFRPGTSRLFQVRYTGDRTPPYTTSELRDQVVPAGGRVTLRAAACGTPPLQYQWEREGKEIPGATSADYTVTHADRADDKTGFQCRIRNAFGSTVTNTATLAVRRSEGETTHRPGALRLPPSTVQIPPTHEHAPGRLSETGVFASVVELKPSPGVLPYDVNAPLWSDGAVKRRWMALPPGQRIGFAAKGEWHFPPGTVFIKHFELPVDVRRPEIPRRLETRLLVVDGTGLGYGVTYKWRPDGSDADLLVGGLSEAIPIRTAQGTHTQTWTYPSRADCLACHTAAAGFVLGVKTRQLNRPFTNPATGSTQNQLRTWNDLGLFEEPLEERQLAHCDRLVTIEDRSAPLDVRVRSYLDANCAHCHRPGNAIRSTFDARFDTPLADQRMVNAPTVSDSLSIAEPRVVAPGEVRRSMAYQRLLRHDNYRMPPVGVNVPDAAAIEALGEWIRGLPATAP